MSNKSAAAVYTRSLEKWDRLRTADQLSLPQRVGAKAIVYANNVGSVGALESSENDRILTRFEREAHECADTVEQLGGRAYLYAGLTHEVFNFLLTERSISDIVIIGNGSFSDIYSDTSTSNGNQFITWSHLARMTDHLKQGAIVQRTCGSFEDNPVRMSPPFGTFVVSDHRHLYGAINEPFNPDDPCLDDRERLEEEDKIRQVSPHERMALTYVADHFMADED